MVDSIKGAGLNLGTDGIKAGGVKSSTDAFSNVLKDSIEKVNSLQTEADKAIEGLAKGEVTNIHDTMIAIEKANVSFNMMVQVRNKLVQAYEEIIRMQV